MLTSLSGSVSVLRCPSQHGERAVRTPFAPEGFMPQLPATTEPTDAPPAATADAPADTAEGMGEESAEAGAIEQVPEYPDAPEAASSVVTLVFPEAVCPERFVFVLHQLGPDTWVRDHGEDSLQGRRDRGC